MLKAKQFFAIHNINALFLAQLAEMGSSKR
jgi:hypothetical protein